MTTPHALLETFLKTKSLVFKKINKYNRFDFIETFEMTTSKFLAIIAVIRYLMNEVIS